MENDRWYVGYLNMLRYALFVYNRLIYLRQLLSDYNLSSNVLTMMVQVCSTNKLLQFHWFDWREIGWITIKEANKVCAFILSGACTLNIHRSSLHQDQKTGGKSIQCIRCF